MKLSLNFICCVFVILCLLACGKKPSGSSMSAFDKGKSYLADGDRLLEFGDEIEAKKYYEKAITQFESEARTNADKSELARMLGKAQYRMRDFDNSIQWLTKATQLDQSDAVAFQYLGYSLVNKSKIEEAITAFRSAFSNNPSGVVKTECIDELMKIGEFAMSVGETFVQQGTPQGQEYKMLGMRIMAMGLEFSNYDLDKAHKIQEFAFEMKDEILINWIGNIIEADGQTTFDITVPVQKGQ